MKLKNKLTCEFLVCGLTVFLLGCENLITETSPSNITMENYYTQPEHASSAVNAIYEDLRTVHNGGGFGGAAWLMLEFPTGLTNTIALGSSGPINSSIRNLDINSDNPYLGTYWNSHYRGIANANVAIEKIPEIQMNTDSQNKLLGEARFLRAYYYYNLVRIFGDVPLILEPLDITSEQLAPERATIADVYNVIIEDLQWAENSGLPFTDQSGRVSLGATKTLMASVYLSMAGYPLQAGSEYFNLAKDKALEVIESGEFYLFDSYADFRNEETENMGEHILMVQYDKDIIDRNGFQQLFTPNNMGISLYASETGMIFPIEEFIESYESEDKRTEEKQFYYREFTLETNRNTVIDLGGWHIYKWFDPIAHTETAFSGLNWPLFRYAELLLIYAEAENEISGPTQTAYEAVNQIRRRAELPELSGLTQEEFRDATWEEKWHELSYENKTWFDMVRLLKAYNLTTGEFEDFVGHTFVYGPNLTQRELLFPIPTAEIGNNENLVQNPGY
ncbi:MAG: RagB/SusD family nutrient uptake outer membrane protein [Anditalea sp.]